MKYKCCTYVDTLLSIIINDSPIAARSVSGELFCPQKAHVQIRRNARAGLASLARLSSVVVVSSHQMEVREA